MFWWCLAATPFDASLLGRMSHPVSIGMLKGSMVAVKIEAAMFLLVPDQVRYFDQVAGAEERKPSSVQN
jgi:hypothetical protein